MATLNLGDDGRRCIRPAGGRALAALVGRERRRRSRDPEVRVRGGGQRRDDGADDRAAPESHGRSLSDEEARRRRRRDSWRRRIPATTTVIPAGPPEGAKEQPLAET